MHQNSFWGHVSGNGRHDVARTKEQNGHSHSNTQLPLLISLTGMELVRTWDTGYRKSIGNPPCPDVSEHLAWHFRPLKELWM